MFGIKRLDTFMLQRFLPLLLMTFFIVLFIVLMHFLFMRIDDLVGKGLSFSVLGELFFYAAITMVPTALPLAVLLASLMVFGNLGEKLELTAMKAAGISLFRIMRPLIVFMCIMSIAAFFFQNNVLPIAQTKMWTLMFSVKQKSPEVEIPEKSFYADIPGMNLYVDRKDPETGMLYGMIIYDLSRGYGNSRVILADSGKFSFTEDKTKLFLHLHSGEMFENLNDNSMGIGTSGYMPFRRESFTDKQVYFSFDANFNRMDESGIRSQYVGQNVTQLRRSIDSINRRVDSIGAIYASELTSQRYIGIEARKPHVDSLGRTYYTLAPPSPALAHAVDAVPAIDLDSIYIKPDRAYEKSYISQAIADARRSLQDYEYRALMLTEQAKDMRKHNIEMQRKFTLPFAILVFFFIGAPLGAIIKKGGIGTPLIISVFLFIVYFIFDNSGYKMARDGKVDVWLGMWLSTIVLTPLGIFFTTKAVDDSAVFNADAYRLFFARLVGRTPGRSLSLKELVMQHVDPATALDMLQSLQAQATAARSSLMARPRMLRFLGTTAIRHLRQPLNTTVEYLSNTTDQNIINLLNKYPFEPAPRNIDNIIATTDSIIQRFKENA
ncbi:MAG: LptF/LptG family permease [Muribaculaceae bacterium]|nr:LptF/LptG family permease [Muribaculaceae bacterium]